MARDHGTYARYKLDGCRCYPCAAACSDYRLNRERAIAYGTWNPWVPAEPVRQHIRALQDFGIGLRRIADAAGVDRKRLQAVLNGRSERGTGPQERLRPAISMAILAVEPSFDLLGDNTVIDATGTHRRLQALVTIGWSQAKLADRLGWTRSNFGGLMHGEQTIAATARKVRALYDELWDQPPPEETHRDRIAASRARNHATARGWVPPAAWDDERIDAPDAGPELGETPSRGQALAEDAYELITRFGCSPEEAAQRLGVSAAYVQQLHREESRRRKVVAA